jgi:hypothetical protein
MLLGVVAGLDILPGLQPAGACINLWFKNG